MDYVLSIGIDDYVTIRPPTPFAENDATEICKQLSFSEETNAQLLLGKHATIHRIIKAAQIVSSKIEPGDRFLFFYAGHGQNINSTPHICAFDSDDDSSWISIEFFLGEIISKCRHSIWFIDACESTHSFGSRATQISGFDLQALKERTLETDYCCIFSATSHKGIADVIADKKHGIFSYFLINALRGVAIDALVNGKILTADSLKNYLFESMKRYGKNTSNTYGVQVPFQWGKNQGDIIILEFEETQLRKYEAIPEISIPRISFVTKRDILVSSLSGFIKGKHTLPKYYTSAVDTFISKISQKEIEDNVEHVAEGLKSLFILRRRDFKCDIEGDYGRFSCPYCNYDCCVEINRKNLKYVTMTMKLTPIDINRLFEKSDDLDSNFPYWFDYLLYELPKRIIVNDLIDKIEDLGKGEEFNLKYQEDEYLIITIGSDREITIKPDVVEIHFKTQEEIPSMIDGLKEIANYIAQISSNQTLLLGQ